MPTTPLPIGRTNAQTLPALALRAAVKAGLGNSAQAAQPPPSDEEQQARDRGMAQVLGLIPPGSQNQKQTSSGPMPTASATAFPKFPMEPASARSASVMRGGG